MTFDMRLNSNQIIVQRTNHGGVVYISVLRAWPALILLLEILIVVLLGLDIWQSRNRGGWCCSRDQFSHSKIVYFKEIDSERVGTRNFKVL